MLAAVLLAGSGIGCRSFGYYGQAVGGECEILTKRRSIEKWIASPDTPPEVKAKLELILQFRHFAEAELKLRPDGHYLSYVDLNRRFVVWNIHATPEFSLEPKRWWYPVVGRLKYRGYFAEADAQHYAANLKKRGFDVYVDGVEAYSTLGWFHDPVLNTFIQHDEADLADIIFHELAHQRVFIPGDTDFNEAFATTVGEEGVHRWLRAKGNTEALKAYEREAERHNQFVALVLNARSQLKTLFKDSGFRQLDTESKRRRKAEIIERLRADYQKLKSSWGGYTGYDHWFSQSLDNAQLNTVATYDQLVPAFRRMLSSAGGDFEKFYKDVRALGKLTKEERLQLLNHFTDLGDGGVVEDSRFNQL